MLVNKKLMWFPLASLLLLGFPAAHATENRVIDVATLEWPSAKSGVSTREIESVISNSVAPTWRSYTTFEGVTEKKPISFALGSTLSSSIRLNSSMPCSGNASSSLMINARQEVYKRLGIQDWKNRYLILIAPSAGCVWTGISLIGNSLSGGGVMILQDSNSAQVIIHELGHSLGLGHSNLLSCGSGKSDGPWGQDCRAIEYGGAIDIMSNVDVNLPLRATANG